MKSPKTWLFGAFTLASAALLSAPSALAQNGSYNPGLDLTLYFQRAPGATGTGGNDTLYAAPGTNQLTTTYVAGTAGPAGYTVLGNLNAGLTDAYGLEWSGLTDLFMGGIGNRGSTAASGFLFTGTVDPFGTVYYTQQRANAMNPGLANSNPNNRTAAQFTTLNSGINQLTNEFENDGTGVFLKEDKSASFIDDQNPFSGPNLGLSFSNDLGTPAMNSFSGPISFGAAGSGILLALDFYRMKPSSSPMGEDAPNMPFADRTPQFLGNLVLKDTGEVGFVTAVPEPSSALLVLFGGLFAASARRRRQ